MPIKLAELTRETKRINVTVGRQSMWVIYRPHELTPAREAMLQNMSIARAEHDEPVTNPNEIATLQLIRDLVEDWDVEGPLYAIVPVTDDDGNDVYAVGDEVVAEGEKVTPEPDHTLHVSSRLIALVMQAIQDDLSDDPKQSRGNSRGGSFRKGR